MKSFKQAAIVSIFVAAAAAATATATHAQFLKPTDNLVIDGIPPISEALVAKVRAYTDFKPATIVAWHPTQSAVLMRTRLNNTLQLHTSPHQE